MSFLYKTYLKSQILKRVALTSRNHFQNSVFDFINVQHVLPRRNESSPESKGSIYDHSTYSNIVTRDSNLKFDPSY